LYEQKKKKIPQKIFEKKKKFVLPNPDLSEKSDPDPHRREVPDPDQQRYETDPQYRTAAEID
jgi:hypothetical protein